MSRVTLPLGPRPPTSHKGGPRGGVDGCLQGHIVTGHIAWARLHLGASLCARVRCVSLARCVSCQQAPLPLPLRAVSLAREGVWQAAQHPRPGVLHHHLHEGTGGQGDKGTGGGRDMARGERESDYSLHHTRSDDHTHTHKGHEDTRTGRRRERTRCVGGLLGGTHTALPPGDAVGGRRGRLG